MLNDQGALLAFDIPKGKLHSEWPLVGQESMVEPVHFQLRIFLGARNDDLKTHCPILLHIDSDRNTLPSSNFIDFIGEYLSLPIIQ